jgi:hypothetical protein
MAVTVVDVYDEPTHLQLCDLNTQFAHDAVNDGKDDILRVASLVVICSC